MSNDYIRREDVIDKINKRQRKLIYCFGFENDIVKIMDIAKSIVIAIPSAQPELESANVAPVRVGHWVPIGDEPYDEWECDRCGFVIDGSGCLDPDEYRDIYKFCPNCGAKMDGDEQDE